MRGKKTVKRKSAGKSRSVEMPTSLFLQKEMVAVADKAVVYDLMEEFRGARKNRGVKIYLSLALITAILLGGTFGITRFIEQNNRNIAIDISDFEDINMQELLYSLRNAGKLLADMRNNMEQLKGQMSLEMRRLRLKALEDLELLKKQHSLTEAQRAAMSRKILEDRDRRLASMNAEYNGRLKDKEKAIEDAKKKMGDDNVRLRRKMDTYVQNLSVKLSLNQSESKASKAKAEELMKQMGDNYALKSREEKKDFEKKILDLTVKMKKAEEYKTLFTLYRKALVHYAFLRGEQGHVIHAEKDGSLLVVLNPMAELEKSTRGLVVSNKGAVIAGIEITPKDGMARARVVKKMSSVKISPFDLIIVQKE